MKDNKCIFCEIASGNIPSATLYEDEDFRVIFDLGPATHGHALILPKKHAADIFELDEDSVAKVFVLAKKMAEKMTKVLGCDGFNILQNNGEVAGQTMFHFHVHLIPRYKDDSLQLAWKTGSVTDDELKELVKKMKEIG